METIDIIKVALDIGVALTMLVLFIKGKIVPGAHMEKIDKLAGLLAVYIELQKKHEDEVQEVLVQMREMEQRNEMWQKSNDMLMARLVDVLQRIATVLGMKENGAQMRGILSDTQG